MLHFKRILLGLAVISIFQSCYSDSLSNISINFGGSNIASEFVTEDKSELWGDTRTYNTINSSAINVENEPYKIALASNRFGTVKGAFWGYNVKGLRSGIWQCTLHWAEIRNMYFSDGARVFYVGVNGEERQVDVFQNVGAFAQYNETFSQIQILPIVTDAISISFQGIVGDPFLSALSCHVEQCTDGDGIIEPCSTELKSSRKRAIAFNLGGPEIGRYKMVPQDILTGTYDEYSENSQSNQSTQAVEKVLKSQIYGKDWGLTISNLETGTWQCSALFCEIHTDSFRKGSRLFNLKIGNKIRKAIDVYDQVGENQIHAETFSSITVSPATRNEIEVRLFSVKGNAFLSGLRCDRIGCVNSQMWRQDEPCFSEQILWPIPRPKLLDYAYVNFGGQAFANLVVPEKPEFLSGNSEVARTNAVIAMSIRFEWVNPLLSTHRYAPNSGSFSYTINDLQTGIYSCQAHMAETYIENFEEGIRCFNIHVQDQVMEKIDVFAYAGGNSAFVVDFFDVPVYFRNNNSITIKLEGIPGKGDPFISAFTCKRQSCINLNGNGDILSSACWDIENNEIL